MKKILVTGGSGFIGSHLCNKLLDLGNKVICLDNFYSGRKENIKNLLKYEHFELIVHDILKPFFIDVDEIYNLACPGSPIRYQNNPVNTIKINVIGSINLLDLAKKLNIPILQASTSEVYGNPLKHPQTEDYPGNVNSIGIRACYEEGKRCAETLFFEYYRQYQVKIKVVRIFNIYGPTMQKDDGRVVSNFIWQALNNNKISVYGTGLQTRSFCYIDDLVEALIKMMESDKNITGPLNIGNPEEHTILDLVKMIVNITKSDSEIEYMTLPVDDPKKIKPDITKAKKLINWWPKTNLYSGLVKTVKSYQDFYTKYNLLKQPNSAINKGKYLE